MIPVLSNVFVGTFIHSVGEDLIIEETSVVGINVNGEIVFFEKESLLEELKSKYRFDDAIITKMTKTQFMMPGLIDAHIHAPQYAYIGTGVDMPLLEWLNTYTYPVEKKFKDIEFAKPRYENVVRHTLTNGTTTASYYATIHTDSTVLLCDIAERRGQRAFIGKVNMDGCCSPKYYVEPTEQCIKETERFLQILRDKKYKLVKPIITPRFALSCSPECMMALGNIAKLKNLHIQTHIAENVSEMKLIKETFPSSKNYVDVYDKYKLITDKTLLAHGIYLNDEELEVIKEKGASVVHCPNSNLSIASGLLNIRRLLNKNIKTCLGTDVAGGYSITILDSIRRAIHVSNTVYITSQFNEQHCRKLNFKEAFRLATLDGARALSIDDQVGNFVVGKKFDALLIDSDVIETPIVTYDDESIETETLLQKFLYIGDDRNIIRVYVDGKKVVDKCA